MNIWSNLKYFKRNEKNHEGKLAWGDPDKVNGLLLKLLDEIREESKSLIVVHCAYDSSGHVVDSEHYRGNAVDFHFVNLSLKDGLKAVESVLKRHNLLNKSGLGVYFWWASKGFHLDLRGYYARWASDKPGNYDLSFDNAVKKL